MTLTSFLASNEDSHHGLLRALWLAGHDNWQKAHEIAQEIDTRDGAWVHAHLHRVEGDIANAGYWYRRAGRPMQSGDLSAEWETITTQLLQSNI